MSIFDKKLQRAPKAVGLQSLVVASEDALNNLKRNQDVRGIAMASLATESIQSSQVELLNTAVETLTAAVESMANNATGLRFSAAQKDAAITAGLFASDVQSFLAAPVTFNTVATENMSIIPTTGMGDAFTRRTLAVEAYDEKENRKAAQYSVAYNLAASRQNEFGEAFFPTVTVTPDNIGFSIQARLINVFNDFKRDISGDLDKYNKKNILRGEIDHTLLKNDQTAVVPVVRTESAKYFVPAGTLAPYAVDREGESIQTAPLAFDKKFSLLAISQAASTVSNGLYETSDSLDPSVTLKNVYLKIGDDIVKFRTVNLASAVFTPSVTGLERQMNLTFETDSLMINKNTKLFDGSALGDLASIVTNDLVVYISLKVAGSVNIETGDTTITAYGAEISKVLNSSGDSLALNHVLVAPLVTLVTPNVGIGYDLQAYVTNLNRRQRGQLLDTTYYNQLYPVPLRSPITVLRPLTVNGQTDSGDLAALITATQIRASNQAVTTLIDAISFLDEFVDSRNKGSLTVTPDILGVGRLLVVPSFKKVSLDLAVSVASLDSNGRMKDIQATLVNTIREMALNLHRDSGYQAAANAVAGGQAPKPVVLVGTDPVLANYLMVEGDFRTLGADFDVRVVSTTDLRVAGKIFVSFGQSASASDNTPNPLHFGNMAWKPEMTLVLPIDRGGQSSKELTVQPSFRHIVHLPVAGVINVTNMTGVVASRLPFFTKEQ